MPATYVRITDTDPARRECHPANVIVCAPDSVAETLQNDSGWFDRAPIEVRDTIHALQRAVVAGADTDGLAALLGVAVERGHGRADLSGRGATLPDMNTTGSAGRAPVDEPVSLDSIPVTLPSSRRQTKPPCGIKTGNGHCGRPADFDVICHGCSRGFMCADHLRAFRLQGNDDGPSQCNGCGQVFASIVDAIVVMEL